MMRVPHLREGGHRQSDRPPGDRTVKSVVGVVGGDTDVEKATIGDGAGILTGR
jgi:hypothetical protein